MGNSGWLGKQLRQLFATGMPWVPVLCGCLYGAVLSRGRTAFVCLSRAVLVLPLFLVSCGVSEQAGDVPGPSEVSVVQEALEITGLHVYVREEAQNEPLLSKPRIYLVNGSTQTISNFKLHYYFSVGTGQTPVVEDYYTPNSTAQLEQVPGAQPSGLVWRVVYDYAGVTLAPGQSTDTNTPPDGNVVGLHTSDWSPWNKDDDYSHHGVTPVFTETTRIPVFAADGTLIHGTVPSGLEPPPPPPPERLWFTVSAPEALQFNQVALGAGNELRVGDGATVYALGQTGYTPVTNTGLALTDIGLNARTATVFGGGAVTIRGAQIAGNVTASGALTVQPGSSITGTTFPAGTPFVRRTHSWSVTVPETVSTLPSGNTKVLVPGRYPALAPTSGQTIQFSQPGVYFVESLLVAQGATLSFSNTNGPIVVHVKNAPFVFRGSITKSNTNLFNVHFTFSGTATATLEKPFTGTVIAPRAKVELWAQSPGQVHRGSFFARNVELKPNAVTVLRPLQLDCTAELAQCRGSFACPLPDTDGDLLPDCEEEADASAWTDPAVPNGVRMRWDDECVPAAGSDVCAGIDDLSEVTACTSQAPDEEKLMSSGWGWPLPSSPNLCDPSYGFAPSWSLCPENRTLHAEGYMLVQQAGMHCFRVEGAAANTCASLFVGDATEGIVSTDGTVCHVLPQGRTKLAWTRAAAPGALGELAIEHCFGGASVCEPTRLLPPELMRPDDCAQGECSEACTCGDGAGACEDDADCADGLVCAGDGPLFNQPAGTLVCITETAANEPGSPGSYAPPVLCSTSADCPSGDPCLEIGQDYGFPYTVKVCFDQDLCIGANANLYCGQLDSRCGFCECVPSCDGKQCGDAPDDGCGGQCLGYCEAGQTGCTSSAACGQGTVCIDGTCADPSCASSGCDPQLCGSACPACEPLCAGRQCGTDPRCGVSCGECLDGATCESGMCKIEAPPRPELPPHPGTEPAEELGTLPGQFTVTPQGRPSYSLPLQLPPGRGGVTPQVSLVYGGTTMPGLPGVGWGLSAGSTIGRCNRSVAVDGWAFRIEGAVNDAICLDGQRLILVSGNALTDGAQYRTELDSFAQITYRTSGTQGEIADYWEVRTKGGDLWRYGTDFVAIMYRAFNNSVATRAWPATELINRAGVVTHYSYTCQGERSADTAPDKCLDDPLLVSIEYGAKPGAPVAQADQHLHRVRFVHEPRQNVHVGRTPAWQTTQRLTQRLKEVRAEYAGQLLWRYELSYRASADGAQGDLLSRVKQCAAHSQGESCLPHTFFSYAEDTETPLIAAEYLEDEVPFPPTFGGGPVEKDEEQREEQAKAKPTLTLDFDGDGRPDFLHPTLDDDWALTPGLMHANGLLFGAQYPIHHDLDCVGSASVGDFNGDGLSDLVDGCPTSSGQLRVLYSTADFDDPFEESLEPMNLSEDSMIFALDADADGITDAMSCGNGGMKLMRFKRQPEQIVETEIPAFPAPVQWSCNWQHGRVGRVPAPLVLDIDGDGTANLVVREANEGRVWTLVFEPWVGTEPRVTWVHTGISLTGSAPRGLLGGPLRPMDINGDGLLDMLEHRATLEEDSKHKRVEKADADQLLVDTNLLLNLGTSKFEKFSAFIPNVESSITEIPDSSQWEDYSGISGAFFELGRVLDYDRDGRDDLLSVVNTGASTSWYMLKAQDLGPAAGGRIRFRAQALPNINAEARWNKQGMSPMFADFDADGAVDVLFFEGGTARLQRGTQPERYLLTGVRDGMNNRINVVYDQYAYSPAERSECGVDQPRCLPTLGPVVWKMSTEWYFGDVEGTTAFQYHDARVGLHGRGPLGFKSRKVYDYRGEGEDLEVIRVTTEEYDNGQQFDPVNKLYPFAGRLTSLTTESGLVPSGIGPTQVDTKFKTTALSEYSVESSDAGRPFVVPLRSSSIQSQVLPEGEVVLTGVVSDFKDASGAGYDAYGNSLFQRTALIDHTGTIVQRFTTNSTFYEPGRRNGQNPADPSRWEVGLLAHREIEAIDGITRGEVFAYDEATGLPAVQFPSDARRMSFVEYDSVGNVEHSWVESQGLVKESVITYDALGLRPQFLIDPMGFTTAVDLEPATGRLLSTVDPNGSAVQHVYDAFGREVKTITPTGQVTTELTAYSEEFPFYTVLKVVEDASSSVETKGFFDSRGRLWASYKTGLDGVEIEQVRSYNELGLLESEELPHPYGQPATGSTVYEYDVLGSVRKITSPGDEGEPPAVQTFQYGTRFTSPASLLPGGLAGARTTFIAQKVDADGVINTTFSGPQQEALARREGEGSEQTETHMGYGSFGQVNSYETAGNSLQIVHDDFGRVLSVTDSDLGTISYTYDGFDRTYTMTDADGSFTSYQYDALDRLTLASHDGVSERFVFDRDLEAEAGGEPPTENSLGRIVRAVREKPTGSVIETFRYEAKPGNGDPLQNRGMLETVRQQGAGREFETGYEYYPGTGRVMVQHYPETAAFDPFGVRYCYDSLGTVTHVFRATAPVTCEDPDVGPAPFWKRTSTKDGLVEDGYALGSGVTVDLDLDPVTYRLSGHSMTGTNTTVGFQYMYEPGGRLRTEVRSGSLDFTRDYAYKQNGLLDSVVQDAQPVYTPSYNANHQLESGPSTLGTFSYEGAPGQPWGNRLQRVEPGPGQTEATTFDYDGRGNQNLRQGPTIPGGRQDITYNAFNLPDSITTGIGPSATTVQFDYTASGARMHTLREDVETWHFADIYEHEEAGTFPAKSEVDRFWVFAKGQRVAVVERERPPLQGSWSESELYLHNDRAGSIVATSGNSGNISAELDYDVYGEPKQPLPVAYGYTGHRHEQELGLIDMGGRFYDPKFGVFLSADPVSPFGGGSPRLNRYAYVGYDPVNFIDPTGYFVIPMIPPLLAAFGNLAITSLIVPGLNYLTTGQFSYDWSKDTWERVGILAAGIGAGIGCGAAASTGFGAALAAGFCGGLLGSLLGGLEAGDSGTELIFSVTYGTFFGVASAGIGQTAQLAVLNTAQSYYWAAVGKVAATTGSSIGFQAAFGEGEINWTQVGIQAGISLVLAVVEAQDLQQTEMARGAGAAAAAKASKPSGLAQGAVDKALGSAKEGTGPLLGYVTDAKGVPHGKIHVVEYHRTPSGARLVLRYDDLGSGAEKLNWLQTIIAEGVADDGVPFLDNGHWGHGTALYFSEAELQRYTFGDSLYFHDNPSRQFPTNWTAELSIVGRFSGSPHYNSLGTLSWGFTSTRQLMPIQMINNPSLFHTSQLP